MPDVFISYSRRDSGYVRRLARELDARGKQSWIDTEGIRDAEVFPAALRRAIESSDAFVFVISPDSTFKAAVRDPSTVPLRPRSRLGTVVSYILNRAATVRFNVERLLPGRTTKQGAHVHCVAPARHNRKDPRCMRIVVLRGNFILNGKAGKNAFRFTGRLAGKELARGSYMLVASPSADGIAGTIVKIAFRVGS